MSVCISERLTLWNTLPSKRGPVCVHAGQRFDYRVSQKVELSLEPYIQTYIYTRTYACCPVCIHTGQRFEGRVSQKVKLSPDFHFPDTKHMGRRFDVHT